MDFIRSKINKVAEVMSIAIIGVMVVLVTWQVVARYLFNSPSAWSEQLSRYLFVWLVLVNAAYIFGKREHMNLAFVVGKMPPRLRLCCGVASEAIILLFALGVFLFGGVQAVRLAMPQVDSAMPFLRMGIVYLAMPISGMLTTFYSACNIVDLVRGATVVSDEIAGDMETAAILEKAAENPTGPQLAEGKIGG